MTNEASSVQQRCAPARAGRTARALAEAGDVVLTSLPVPPEIEAVALDRETGLVAGVREEAYPLNLPDHEARELIMGEKAPACSHLEGITVADLFQMFPNDTATEA